MAPARLARSPGLLERSPPVSVMSLTLLGASGAARENVEPWAKVERTSIVPLCQLPMRCEIPSRTILDRILDTTGQFARPVLGHRLTMSGDRTLWTVGQRAKREA